MAADYNIIASQPTFFGADGSVSQTLDSGTLDSINFGADNTPGALEM